MVCPETGGRLVEAQMIGVDFYFLYWERVVRLINDSKQTDGSQWLVRQIFQATACPAPQGIAKLSFILIAVSCVRQACGNNSVESIILVFLEYRYFQPDGEIYVEFNGGFWWDNDRYPCFND